MASAAFLNCWFFDFCRLSFCKVTGDECSSVTSALKSDHCKLRELDLSFNYLTDQQVTLLTEIQRDSCCSLKDVKYALHAIEMTSMD